MVSTYDTYMPHEYVITKDNHSAGVYTDSSEGYVFSGGAVSFVEFRVICTCREALAPVSSSEPVKFVSETTIVNRSPLVDKESWSEIRNSSRIKMTHYQHASTVTKYPVLRDAFPEVTVVGKRSVGFQMKNNRGQWVNMPNVEWNGSNYTYRSTDYESVDMPFVLPPAHSISYQETRCWTFWDLDQYNRIELSTLNSSLGNAIETVKTDSSTALHKRWDVMTDLFEVTPTYNQAKSLLVGAMNPLRTIRNTIQTMKSAKKSHKEISSKWLEFRYGIMPVIYSANDLVKLINERQSKFQTERAKQVLQYSSKQPAGEGLFYTRTGNYLVRATAKGYFSSPSNRMYSGTSLNILNSTWEVIPYSLVVDWFSNFGNWLYAQTNVLSNLSMNSMMCYTVKRTEDVNVEAMFSHQGKQINGSVMNQTIRHYSRHPFSQRDIKLVFSPRFSSFKRWADAYSMSIGPLQQALRRLR